MRGSIGNAPAWGRAAAEGKASVELDGKLLATIDLHASKTTMRWIAWQKTNASSGKHTLKISCLGTSGHARVDVDAFVVLR